jgi:hypothetical protein
MDFHTFIEEQEISKLRSGNVAELFQNSKEVAVPIRND